MKNFSLIVFALVFAPAVCMAQALPDDPSAKPAPAAPSAGAPLQSTPVLPRAPLPSDALWMRVEQIANGQEVLVTNTYGPALRCRFAGATDAYLFCDPPGTPEGTGWRFERAGVINVVAVRQPRNWHPGVLSAMIAGGLVTGICATGQTDAGHATEAGLIGALVIGAIASPFVLLPPPQFSRGFGAGIAFRPRGFAPGPHRFLPFPR